MDPVWGYEAVNAEAQQGDPSSLLNWMRNMIALRKLFRVFGRGTIEFLEPANRKVLAYLRCYEGEQVLCVANLSRFAQPVDLDLAKLKGMIPVEMLGYVEFPPIEQHPYRLTLAPYSFFWLELQQKPDAMEEPGVAPEDGAALQVRNGWEGLLERDSRLRLETVNLPEYLPKQRWFGGKSRHITASRIYDWVALPKSGSALALVEVQFGSGNPENYVMPLAMTFGEAAEELRRSTPNAIIASIVSDDKPGLLHDGILDNGTCTELFSLIENTTELKTAQGQLKGLRGKAFPNISGSAEEPLQVRRGSAEQSNTSILYGDRFFLKLFRHPEPGVNPDVEIGRYLTENTSFDKIPPFAGSMQYKPATGGVPSTLVLLQGLVPNEGSGWTWTLEELDRYYETCATAVFPEAARSEMGSLLELSENPPNELMREHAGLYLDSAATLGKRTAELHLALALPTKDPAFSPEPFTAKDLEVLLADVRERVSSVLELLRERVPSLPDEVLENVASVLSRRRRILDRLSKMELTGSLTERIRIHGDYHLGQVLRVKTDFVILDFEGEPARPLAYRRLKQCPLKDVAGMLRSFSYAAYAALINYTSRRPEDLSRLEPWAQLWERSAATAFLHAYRETSQGSAFLPANTSDLRKLLDVFLMDKVFYEVHYELDSRPPWVRIPLLGIMSLLL
jgi:maltose alpha-D-glucosyltransferase/alpha-amylase